MEVSRSFRSRGKLRSKRLRTTGRSPAGNPPVVLLLISGPGGILCSDYMDACQCNFQRWRSHWIFRF